MAQRQPIEPVVNEVLELAMRLSPANQTRLRELLEDQEDIRIAEERVKNVRAGREETVPLEEVMKRYGMES